MSKRASIHDFVAVDPERVDARPLSVGLLIHDDGLPEDMARATGKFDPQVASTELVEIWSRGRRAELRS